MPDEPSPNPTQPEAVTRKMTASGGGMWEPPTIEEAAKLFPGYEVLGLLGRGGMGAVYQARQIELDRLVAIKLLPLEISADADFADRFRREARAMAKLNHPNIISVYDFGTTSAGHLFFVMEFVEGANLHAIIRAQELSADQALWLAGQVCTALAYAHGKGVVHRDIKPANVMVDTEGNAKVADFGLARLTDPSAENLGHTQTGTVMGTPDYMAPEQMRGMNVDHRADIYSVGVMLYEMLCREVPRGIFSPPSARTGCDHRVDSIVVRAMQSEPDRRYQSTQEMRTDMEAARTPLPQAMPQQAQPRAAMQPRAVTQPRVAAQHVAQVSAPKKSSTMLYAGIVAAVVVVVGAAIYLGRPKPKPMPTAVAVEKPAHAQGTPPPKPPPPPPTGKPIASTGAKPAPPPGPPVGVTTSTSEQWVDLLQKYFALIADRQQASTAVDRVPEGARLKKTGAFNLPTGSLQNVALRATVRGMKSILSLTVRSLGVADKDLRLYQAVLHPDGSVVIARKDETQTTRISDLSRSAPAPGFSPAARHTVEFRAVDDLLTFIVDGQAFASVRDATLKNGGLSITGDAGMIIEKLEYADLTGVKPAASAPAPAGAGKWHDAIAEWIEDTGGKLPDHARIEGSGIYVVKADSNTRNAVVVSRRDDLTDFALRVTAHLGTPTGYWNMAFRGTEPNSPTFSPNRSSYLVKLNAGKPSLNVNRSGMPTVLQDVDGPRFDVSQSHTVEVRAVGDHLKITLDGAPVADVHDSTFARGGFWVSGSSDTVFEKVEYQDLAGASPPKSGSTQAATGEQWIDILDGKWSAPASVSGDLLMKEAGGMRILKAHVPVLFRASRDLAARATFRGLTDYAALAVRIYDQTAKNGKAGYAYQARLSKNGECILQLIKGLQHTDLGRSAPPPGFSAADTHTIELRAQGDLLTFLLDGKEACSMHDSEISDSHWCFFVGDAGTLIEKLEYRKLTAMPGASTPAAATKDAPFVNSLGMKFVPVPGTKVIFSIWDTRVQDYAAYAQAQEAAGKKVDGSWKTQQKDGVPAGREPDHPVVGVNWEDAQAFCQWLTDKETAEGKLPQGMKYRLPSDEEWSWAVGLPPELGGTPAEKSEKNNVDFPWGKDWPPTKKVGNYADETFHAKFPKDTKDKEKDQPWIKDYTDGYATTSPVGSFPANAYGLYDMGGNEWQWCEDWFDATQKHRVLRGGSWGHGDRTYLLSSYRHHLPPDYRYGSYGFRCVLAPAP